METNGMTKWLRVMLVLVMLVCGRAGWGQCPKADLTGDCFVDLDDFSLLAGQWLTAYDSADLAAFNSEWLTAGVPEPDITWVSINDPGVSGYEGFNGQMSKYETTNAQYCQFLNAAKASGDIVVSGSNVNGASGSNSGADFAGQYYYDLAGPGYTTDGATSGGAARINYSGGQFTVDSGFENHPVTCVSWYGSTAFCNYYGWRLPSEWEWQAVADYNGSYTYGCGTTINNGIANYYGSAHPYGTTPVGAFGVYGYGMADMAGNVWEWTSTPYDSSSRVLRGGCWYYYDYLCSVSSRYHYYPFYRYFNLGFRVCR